MSVYTLDLASPAACDSTLVGGKGANLGLLAGSGFNVPPGFTVSTTAYHDFLSLTGLDKAVAEAARRFDYADHECMERVTAELRATIISTDVPQVLVTAIVSAYEALGSDRLVAVRSSGTAEDLTDASFAGQHDTYLDIRGTADVIDAVRRCWASLWTARATVYREKNGIDDADLALAVVVMVMVDADVAGVLFTGNPLTTATDEMVINASWGLGESVVSGITQPDEYVVDGHTLGVKTRRLGAKEVRVVRDAVTGSGTTEEPVPAIDQERFTLADDDVSRLGRLGRRVTEFYGGLPQDIEFAFSDGELFVLQARPITGVAFSWDEHVEPWQKHPDAGVTFTRAWADELWTGAVTPLFYSIRGQMYEKAWSYGMQVAGVTEVAEHRWFKYYKGIGYYNAHVDTPIMATLFPKAFRPALLGCIAPDAHEAVLKEPFSLTRFLRWQARGYALDPAHSLLTYLKINEARINGPVSPAEGLPVGELPNLSDQELLRYTQERIDYETQYCLDVVAIVWSIPLALCSLGYMLEKWYTGSDPMIFSNLITGAPQRTATVVENLSLWNLGRQLRQSETLRSVFEQNTDGAFFEALERHEEGRAWLARYREFMDANYFRGHADRDFYFPRRSEDPSLDYNTLKAFLSADDSHDPSAAEEAANQRREAAVEDALASIRRSPLGPIKAEAFKVLHSFIMRLLVFRDNHRYFVDRSTMSIKRALLEIGQRMVERGILETDRDVYFLGQDELFDLFQGRGNPVLAKAKIAGRMANFDSIDAKGFVGPMFLRDYQPVEVGTSADTTAGGLRGCGTSPGEATGTARIVRQLKDVGRVQEGDILICHATDPGWTPVFLVIKGVVIETGGMLAHASCLAREYGFPAIQLTAAMDRIPDGATITINGTTGEVTIVESGT